MTAASTFDPGSVEEIVRRAERPDFDRWAEQVAGAGTAPGPSGSADTSNIAAPPAGRLPTPPTPNPTGVADPLRNRRAAACPSCAYEYAGDMWQLLYAGAAGGRKGVPESIRSTRWSSPP
jgi:hypothetical protein